MRNEGMDNSTTSTLSVEEELYQNDEVTEDIADIDDEGCDLELDSDLNECMTRYENELTDKEFQICELQMEKEALIQENTSLMEQNFMLNRLVHDMMLTQSNLSYHLFLTQQTKNEKLCEVILQGDDKKPLFTPVFLHTNCLCVFMSYLSL